jgi:predicted phosphodiesterase
MSKQKETIRVIGDVHGKYKEYLKIAKVSSFSIQVGDLGFNYDVLENLNSNNHCVIAGNHDNYDIVSDYPHFLGDYGSARLVGSEYETSFFYVRGAPSIDALGRVKHFILTGQKSWWDQEEISKSLWDDIKAEYSAAKPKAMITHDCPREIVHMLSSPGFLQTLGWFAYQEFRTQRLLQELYEIHQPDIWFFGHYHKNFQKKYGNTKFVCLNELCWADVNFNWEIINMG